jgi:drug/metabolite transporter (DMT)-like permease
VIWGGSYPAIKATQPFFPPLAFAAFRCVVAAAILLAVGLVAGLRAPALRGPDWARLVVAGIFGNTLFHGLMVTGIHRTSPAHAALLVALSPVFAALLARLLLAEPLGRRRLTGIALAFLGVLVIVMRGGHLDAGTWTGDLLSLGASVAWAAYTVVGKPVLARADARTATTWATVAGALPLLPLGAPGLRTVEWSRLTVGRWALLGYLSAGTIALANLLWYWALARAATARVASFSYLIPVVATVAAIAAGQETVTVALVAGAAAVVGGIALAQRGAGASARAPAGAAGRAPGERSPPGAR